MRKTKSTILEAVHKTAKGLHAAGVMDQVTLREFDRMCLSPVEPLCLEEIKHIREASRVSQAVFAALLNTFDSSGTLYAENIGGLYTINTSTGGFNLIGANNLGAASIALQF